MDKILNESALNNRISEIYKEEQIKVIQEKWDKLSDTDKIIVIEMIKYYYPENSKLISESKWYNTVMDVLGFVDPTGAIDLINGISYWRQGDKLFALLSWISVIPYVGDLVGKPVIGMFKLGGASGKAFKVASAAGDVAKMAELAKASGPLNKMVSSVGKWGGAVLNPLKKLVGKVPGVGPGFVRGVDDYVKLFADANKTMKAGASEAIRLTAKGAKNPLTKVEAKQLKDALETATNFKGFRKFNDKPSFLQYWKSDASFGAKFAAGMPRIWGNPATRSLMRRTKWYLGLLDFVGLGNFVGPEELENQVENLDSKVAEYSQTPEAQSLLGQDLASGFSGEIAQTQSSDDLWKLASQGAPQTTNKPSVGTDDIFGFLFA